MQKTHNSSIQHGTYKNLCVQQYRKPSGQHYDEGTERTERIKDGVMVVLKVPCGLVGDGKVLLSTISAAFWLMKSSGAPTQHAPGGQGAGKCSGQIC